MTKLEAIKILELLRAAFPRQQLTKQSAALFAAHMLGFEAYATTETVMRLITSLKFFPSLSELLSELEPSPLAAHAWAEALANAGAGSILVGGCTWSSELVVEAVRRFGGLMKIGNSTNQVSDRARFCELYSEMRADHIADTYALTSAQATKLLGAGT